MPLSILILLGVLGIYLMTRGQRRADPDAATLAELRRAGSDLERSHEIEFFLYLPDRAAADLVAEQLTAEGFRVEVRSGGGGDDWLCLASREMTPKVDELRRLRRHLTAVAESRDGAYDGWGATVVDASMLAALAARTFRDAFGPFNRPEDLALHLRTHYTPERLEVELADAGGVTLLALVTGSPAGYAQLASHEPPIELGPGGLMLHRFYLEQAWIGRGVAGPLMTAVREEARRQAASYLWLTVWQENPRAIAFYRKCGFVATGTTTFSVGSDPQVDWVMTSPL
jgi:diamine N-acetyltransferase